MLIDIIEELRRWPRKRRVALGWGRGSAHSYRGRYEDLAFEPRENVTIGEMLDEAEAALGKTFEGYKGGEYVMDKYTDCWLAEDGCTSDDFIGPTLLRCLLAMEVGDEAGK